MKYLVVFALLLIAYNALSDEEQWISYKNKYEKKYNNAREEETRFKDFQENLRKIESHNAKYARGEETYFIGITRFSDFNAEQFNRITSHPVFKPEGAIGTFYGKPVDNPAPAVDWREKGAVFPVIYKGWCEASWAFSAAGSLEAQNIIKHHRKVQISVQELVDRTYRTPTCYGGLINDAFDYIKNHGIGAEDDYIYDDSKVWTIPEACKHGTIPRTEIEITGYTFIENNEESLRQAVETIGPISAVINYGFELQAYKGGIFQSDNCPETPLNLAVLIVGYGTENGTDFWIVKNFHGTEYGENGYLRIIRGKNMCGISTAALYPNIV